MYLQCGPNWTGNAAIQRHEPTLFAINPLTGDAPPKFEGMQTPHLCVSPSSIVDTSPYCFHRFRLVEVMEKRLNEQRKDCTIVPTGLSGSGKSYTALWTMRHLLRNKPRLQRKADAILKAIASVSCHIFDC